MPVSDFECQIARGQIGRYLGGDTLSSATMSGLEAHLADCPDCKATVAERRAALVSALEGEKPTRAVVELPIENPLIAALRARAEATTLPEPAPSLPSTGAKAAPRYAAKAQKPGFGKPLALAAVLAAVLVGMSYVSRATGGTGALGTKAEASFAADAIPDAKPSLTARSGPILKTPSTIETKVEKAAKPSLKLSVGAAATDPAEMPAPKAPAPDKRAVKPKAKPVAPAKSVVTRAKRVVKKRVRGLPRVKATRVLRRKPVRPLHRAKRVLRASVRVYGLDGRPLKP